MQSVDDSIEKTAPSLSSFVSEATLPRIPSAPEQPNPLSQFPEERKVASRRYPPQKHPVRPRLASYISLAAAIGKIATGQVPLWIAALVVAGALIGAQVGSWLSARTPSMVYL